MNKERIDISCAFGCMSEARDLLRYLVRSCGPELVGVLADEIERVGPNPVGRSGYQNALEIISRAMQTLESGLREAAEHQDQLLELGVVVDVRLEESRANWSPPAPPTANVA